MEYPKSKRYRSPKNLKTVKKLPCVICRRIPVDVDHWVTRGSGGGDNLSNLSPLCRNHHIEKHSIGNKEFYRRYNSIILATREEFELPPLRHKTDD